MLLYEYHVLVLISFSHVRRNKRSAPPLNNRYPNFLSSSSTTNWSNYNFICQKIFVPFLVAHRCQAHFTWSRKLLFTNTKLWRKSCCSWCCSPANFWIKCSTFRLVRAVAGTTEPSIVPERARSLAPNCRIRFFHVLLLPSTTSFT